MIDLKAAQALCDAYPWHAEQTSEGKHLLDAALAEIAELRAALSEALDAWKHLDVECFDYDDIARLRKQVKP